MPMTPAPILPPQSESVIDDSPAMAASPVRFRDRVHGRTGTQNLLVIRIGGERFAVPLEAIDELVESPCVRALPDAPDGLLGLFTLGDVLLPLYSPIAVLGVAPAAGAAALVLRGGRSRIALAVDDADDVIRISLADVLEAPRTGHDDDVVPGVIRREGELLTLLDARAIVGCFAALDTERG